MAVVTLEHVAFEALEGRRTLTPRQRELMIADAYQISPCYPPDQAPADDRGLAEWWLTAVQDYVSSNF